MRLRLYKDKKIRNLIGNNFPFQIRHRRNQNNKGKRSDEKGHDRKGFNQIGGIGSPSKEPQERQKQLNNGVPPMNTGVASRTFGAQKNISKNRNILPKRN